MKKISFLLFILFINLNIYSQQIVIPEINGIRLSQGYVLNLLNGLGNSSLTNHISNISGLNPAALANFKKFLLGISYQFESEIERATDAPIGWKRVGTALPQGFGLAIPFNEFNFGISFSQKYNSSMIVQPIPITTVENPDGTGVTHDPKFETIIYNHSILVSYLFDKIFENTSLTFGFKYTLGRMHVKQELYLVGIEEDVYNSGWALGFDYKKHLQNENYIQIGLFYDSGIDYKKKANFEGEGLFIRVEEDLNRPEQYYKIDQYKFELVGKVPNETRMDIDISNFENIKLLGSVSYIYWKNVNENYKNQIEFAGSLVNSINESITYSLGFFITDRRYAEENSYNSRDGKFQAIYITAGLLIKSDILNIDLSFADSQLLSGEFRQHTIGRIGVSYNIAD